MDVDELLVPLSPEASPKKPKSIHLKFCSSSSAKIAQFIAKSFTHIRIKVFLIVVGTVVIQQVSVHQMIIGFRVINLNSPTLYNGYGKTSFKREGERGSSYRLGRLHKSYIIFY